MLSGQISATQNGAVIVGIDSAGEDHISPGAHINGLSYSLAAKVAFNVDFIVDSAENFACWMSAGLRVIYSAAYTYASSLSWRQMNRTTVRTVS